MNKLELRPDKDSYTLSFPGIARVSALGENGLFADDLVGKWQRIGVQFTLDQQECDYFIAVNNHHEANGHSHFLIDLLYPDGNLYECKASIVPKTFSLKSTAGKTFVISCTLEVEVK